LRASLADCGWDLAALAQQQMKVTFLFGEMSAPTSSGFAAQFRESAAECLELAEKTLWPEKRRVYLDLARVCFQLALSWEKKGSDGAL